MDLNASFDKIAAHIKRMCTGGYIVLGLHSKTLEQNTKEFVQLISDLQKQGHTFVTLKDLNNTNK